MAAKARRLNAQGPRDRRSSPAPHPRPGRRAGIGMVRPEPKPDAELLAQAERHAAAVGEPAHQPAPERDATAERDASALEPTEHHASFGDAPGDPSAEDPSAHHPAAYLNGWDDWFDQRRSRRPRRAHRRAGRRAAYAHASPATLALEDLAGLTANRTEEGRVRRRRPSYSPGPFKNDWDWVTPLVATGGMPTTTAEVTRLVRAGITHVLNVCDDWPFTAKRVLAGDRRITYLHNPTPDDGRVKPRAWFERSAAFALPAIAAGHPVLVHCLCGSNRGPSTAAYVLMAHGADPADVEALVRAARPRAHVDYLPDAIEALR